MEGFGFCGIDCEKCPAYLATIRNDEALREKTATEWSKMFHSDFKAEDIVCHGCQARGETVFGYCSQCQIRICALAREVITCAECSDYGCEKLSEFFKMIPNEKERMDTRHEAFVKRQKSE